MLMRYGFRMALYPGERWAGGSIPTFFHWVLAGFVLTLGLYHWRHAPGSGPRSGAGQAARNTWPAKFAAAAALLAVSVWGGYRLSGLPVP